MKTWKLAAGIAVTVCLVGWRLQVAVGNLDPQVYDEILQAAPHLVLWVKANLVAMGAGFLMVAGYAVLNEFEYAGKLNASYHDMKEHVEEELTSSVTRSVRSEYREFKESLDARKIDLDEAESNLLERQDALTQNERLVAEQAQTAKAQYDVMAPLRRSYEDEKSTLESYITVIREDSSDTLKILDKALKWVMLAMEDPEKFVSEAKADRVNAGWLERLQRKLQGIEIRIDGTEQESEQLHARVTQNELQQKRRVPL